MPRVATSTVSANGTSEVTTDIDNPATDPTIIIPDSIEGQWWVAHTKSRNEKALARELSKLDIVHYLPLRDRMTRSPRTGRASHSTVPIFSGYLFFAADDAQRYRVMATDRVARTLQVHDQHELVMQLRHIHRVLTARTEFEHLFGIHVGQWVRVVGGPLAGVEGCVLQKLGATRLSLNVSILGQSVLVEVDGNMMEAISPPE